MPRPEAPPSWCDGKYRCALCPGGTGRGGRGFSRPGRVPCTSPAVHMRAPDVHGWSCTDGCVHVHSFSRCQEMYTSIAEFETVQSSLAAVQPGRPTGWCHQCDVDEEVERAAKRPRTDAPRPMYNHVTARQCAPCGRGRDNRVTQLPWCDGLYRCLVCRPEGQARRLRPGQCSDPDGHMARGVARLQVIHLRPAHGRANQVPTGSEEVVHRLVRDGPCGMCNAK